MVDHPGCSVYDTEDLLLFINHNLKFRPEQVQIFTPTPSTNATLMYYTEQDLNGNDIFVEKDRNARMKQKLTITQGTNKTSKKSNGNNNKRFFGHKKYDNFKKGDKKRVGRW